MCRAAEPGKQGMFELPKYEVYFTKKRGAEEGLANVRFQVENALLLIQVVGLINFDLI